ncbi:MAG: hypothetical protein K9K65_14730 [Desulfarculaceae bacterium]|nr:hypothetical protein [Desulfarculaceae bacterium]MCF8049399.1 hypothetical protein [Desulfarculaceae bacterium]MCF8065188.1 hypothetical protein [Desulfarculaceae bacterium]MCF8099095.1 hypothetical protein [Desulfarculaceae bacterium]MCF8124259.1 hypothetical protein [Desulfarculaceae bacterium]
MKHAYDPESGKIVETFSGGDEETARLEGLGYVVADGAEIDHEQWHYKDGKLVAKPAEEVLTLAKAKAYDRASADYEQYVAGLGYTAAWQRTAQAQRLALQKVSADANATAEQAQAAQAVEDRFQALEEFLVIDLGLYFAKVGKDIFAAGSVEDLAAIEWNFHQFDEADPKVTMHVDVFPGLAVAKGTAAA